MNNTEGFTGLAEKYEAGRPSYSRELINVLYSEYGFSSASVVADVGSGTGKFARLLLEKGSFVFGVEPNDDMRNAAAVVLKDYEKFSPIKGTADDTTIGDGSVDFVTAAQAFHWFDVSAFKKECGRILRLGGIAVLIWNMRDPLGDVNRETSDIYRRYCPKFKGFSGGMQDCDPRIDEFFGGSFERGSLTARCITAGTDSSAVAFQVPTP